MEGLLIWAQRERDKQRESKGRTETGGGENPGGTRLLQKIQGTEKTKKNMFEKKHNYSQH